MADLQAKVAEMTKAQEEKDKIIADKEAHIKKQTDDLVNLRKSKEGAGETAEELAKRVAELETKAQTDAKNMALERLSKGDPEKRAKIEKELDSVAGQPTDFNGWLDKGTKAATLAGVTPSGVSDSNYSPDGGSNPSGGGNKNFAESEQGKALAGQLGLKLEVPKENK
jgi:hypothetical protein